MENQKQLSLEDRIKPYIILAKAMQYRAFDLKRVGEEYKDKEQLVEKILVQMLKQVTFKDYMKEEYYKEFSLSNLEQIDKEIRQEGDIVDLVPKTNLKDLLNELEEAELKYKNQ